MANEKKPEKILEEIVKKEYESFTKRDVETKTHDKRRKWKEEYSFDDAFKKLIDNKIIKRVDNDKFEVVKLKIDEERRKSFDNIVGKNKLKEHKIDNGNEVNILAAIEYIYEKNVPFSHGEQRNSNTKPSKDNINVKDAFKRIANQIYNYFISDDINDQKKFDAFHKELCGEVVDIDRNNITWGNAQKLINMTFKYLSCYSDYDKFFDKFSYCHIPIDSIILDCLRVIYKIEEIDSASHFSYKDSNENEYHLPWSEFNSYEMYDDLVKKYRIAMRKSDSRNYNIGRNSWLTVDFHLWGSVLSQK